jgi:hypothetical protein
MCLEKPLTVKIFIKRLMQLVNQLVRTEITREFGFAVGSHAQFEDE